MKKTGFLLALGVVTALTAPVLPAASGATVQPLVARAPDTAFEAATATDTTGVACRRPAPDNRVSKTIHCYGPDDLRAFYGLGPLAASNDGAGQTIVAVDCLRQPDGGGGSVLLRQDLRGADAELRDGVPARQSGLHTGNWQRLGAVRPHSRGRLGR